MRKAPEMKKLSKLTTGKYASYERESQVQSFSETLNKTLHKHAMNERSGEDKIQNETLKTSLENFTIKMSSERHSHPVFL